jgi:hypothetical protein
MNELPNTNAGNPVAGRLTAAAVVRIGELHNAYGITPETSSTVLSVEHESAE